MERIVISRLTKATAAAIALSVCSSVASAATIDVQPTASIGALSSANYVGQTFVALEGVAEDITVHLGWRPVSFRLLVTEVDTLGGIFPTNVLFESETLTAPSSQLPLLVPYTVPLGDLNLNEGEMYAFILDAYVELTANDPIDRASVGLANITGTDAYPEGNYISKDLGPFPSGTREEHFSSGFFTGFPDRDIAFTMNFTATPFCNERDRPPTRGSKPPACRPPGNPDIIVNPLPPSIAMFLGGFGLLGFVARRRLAS